MKKFIITMSSIVLFILVGIVPVTAHANDFEVCQPTDFTADEYVVGAGFGTVLHWDSMGCDSVSIVPADYPGDRPPYGSVSTGAINHDTVFTLTVYDAYGNIGGQRFLTINVRNTDTSNSDDNTDVNNCRIDSFTADDYSIEEGDSTELNWRTTDCDRAKITPEVGTVDVDGNEDVEPDSDTTYTLYAYNEDGSYKTKTVRISVDEKKSCSIDEFKSDDYSIKAGDSARITWRTTGADEVNLSPDYDNQSEDGSVTVRPNRTTTYRLEVDCDNGDNKSKSFTISVDEAISKKAPQAITTVATAFNTSAQLNGIAIPNTTSGTTSAWFEWGPSTNLGHRTSSQNVNANSNSNYYNDTISGLVAGASYYYRAVVQNQNGTAYGDIVRFQTQSVIVKTTPTVVRTQTVRNVVVAQSAPSLLELKVESTYDRMCIGGQIDYTVTYTNISSQVLQKAVLQITHQKEVTFIGATQGNYDVVDRTVTAELGSIAPGQSGTIIVHGRVNDTAIRGNLTVMTATVVYTNTTTKAQENAIAYALVTISSDCPNVLGASVAGFGSFLPNTLLGWLLLILVILALVVLARQLYRRKEVRVS